MKHFKLLLTAITLLLFVSSGFSQNAKTQERAATKAAELNEMIVSINPDLALTEEQTTEIYDITLQKLIDIRAINKNDELSDEDKRTQKKAVGRAAAQRINKEILSKEQRAAKKEARTAANADGNK